MKPRTPKEEPWLVAARRLNDGIRHELRAFPRPAVDAFVRSVGATLGSAETWARYAREAERIAELERRARATRTYLDALAPITVPIARAFPARMDREDHDREKLLAELDAFYRAQHKAVAAAERYLNELDVALRNARPPRRGRAQADQYGVLARVARRYVQLFGEHPTSTPGGPFSNIAVLMLENLNGTAPRDVSRQVRAALKSL